MAQTYRQRLGMTKEQKEGAVQDGQVRTTAHQVSMEIANLQNSIANAEAEQERKLMQFPFDLKGILSARATLREAKADLVEAQTLQRELGLDKELLAQVQGNQG